MHRNYTSSGSMLAKLWGFNIVLLFFVCIAYFGGGFLKSSVLEYSVKADPFDGTVTPIAYVPNWLSISTQNKTLRFEDVAISDFIELPEYDADLLSSSDTTNKLVTLERAEFFTPYMGSYRMNYEEYDGSHLGIDIRAPLGTPVRNVANGVVVKVNSTEGADGKYVVIRHENVKYNGKTQNLYSAYLHLESTAVEVGDKISKGTTIGKVGMTGITTTPHLHFQIDTEDAPFHVYWPYTYKDLNDLGIDFFSAVNMGLGRENAMKYTIHPMNFVQENESTVATSRNEIYIASNTSSSDDEDVATNISNSVASGSTTSNDDEDDNKATTQTDVVNTWKATSKQPFKDILLSSPYYTATKYLYARKVVSGFSDGSYIPYDELVRKDAIVLLGRAYKVSQKENASIPFEDVLPSEAAYGYLASMVQDGIVGSNTTFRPMDTLTRAEAIILLVRLSKTPLGSTETSYFRDVAKTDSRIAYFNAFSKKFSFSKGLKLNPETLMTRGEFANLVYMFLTK